jgi:class 3 adenylate cyclase
VASGASTSSRADLVETETRVGLPRQRAAARLATPRLSGTRRGSVFRVTEPKVLTVVFADIRGSMALSGSLGPSEWWSILERLFEVMCEAVYRFDGWVGNFTGDGVLAVFESESPAPSGDHALRGCEAALWLRHSLRQATAQLERKHGLGLDVRIGINSGEALTGTIGERYSRHYTACGYAVALAKRIEALAEPGGICITAQTATLIGEAIELKDLGSFEVKGAPVPVRVFELLGQKQECEVLSLRDKHRGALRHDPGAAPLIAAAQRTSA